MNLDPEAERPRNYTEAISGDYTWQTYGIRIKWTEPIVPGDFKMPTNEPVKLRLCVETKKDLEVPPEALSAWCWTHIKFKENTHGIWKEIKLHYNPRCTQWDDNGITSYVFQSTVTPVVEDNYRLTFNVKYNRIMIWANNFRVDNLVNVEQKPSVATQDLMKIQLTLRQSATSEKTIIYPSVHFSSNFNEKCDKDEKCSPPAGPEKQDGASGGELGQYRGQTERDQRGYSPGDGEDLEMLVML